MRSSGVHWCGHVEASVGCRLFHLQPENRVSGFAVLGPSRGADPLPEPPKPLVPPNRSICDPCVGGLHCYGSGSCTCHCKPKRR